MDDTIRQSFHVDTSETIRNLEGLALSGERAVGSLHAIEGAFGRFQSILGIAAVEMTARGFVELNRTLEETQGTLAGMLQASKFADSWEEAQLRASRAFKTITKDAVDLPGTSEDFLKAFQLNFNAMKDTGVKWGDTADSAVDKMAQFSDHFTAVAKAYGVASDTAAHEMSALLQGRASLHMPLFAKLMGQLGVKNAAEFNSMTAAKRVEHMQGLLEKNKGMIENFGTTWDAQSSTMEDYLKQLGRAATHPFYELSKRGLGQINMLLSSNLDKLKATAELYGTLAARTVSGAATTASWLLPGAAQALHPLLARVGGGGAATAGAAAAVFGGPMAGLLGGGVFKFLEHDGHALADSFKNLEQVLLPFEAAVTVSGQTLNTMYDTVAGVMRNALPFFSESLGRLGEGLFSTITEVMQGFNRLIHDNKSGLINLAVALGQLAVTAADMVRPALHLMGQGILFFAELIMKGVTGITGTIDAFNAQGRLIEKHGLVWNFKHGADGEGKLAYEAELKQIRAEREIAIKQREAATEDNQITGLKKRYHDAVLGAQGEMDERKRKEAEREARYGAGKVPKGTMLNQDFRGSKFNIEQKFAAGFDPDRVLTAVRQDAGRLAARKLVSPMTGILFGVN